MYTPMQFTVAHVALRFKGLGIMYTYTQPYLTCVHILFGHMCKKFPVDLWHLQFYLAQLQKLTNQVAGNIALDLCNMHI